MPMPAVAAEILARCPRDTEAALAFLRAEGLSKIESAAVLVAHHGLTLAQAKQAVHGSTAWDDVRDRDERLHDALAAAIGSKAC